MKTERTFHRIKNLKVTGGFLTGLDLPFSDGLNCIIGPRGSGKSSALELVRYGFDIAPGRSDKDPLRRRIDSLIRSALDGGRVEIEIETKEGMHYTVSRAADEDPVMISEDGTALPAGALGSDVFRADIYSQNQIESIAETPHYQLDLLDKFREAELRQVRQEMEETVRQLEANSATILPLMADRVKVRGDVAQMDAVREKLKSLSKAEGQDTEEMNRAHAAKGLRDREIKAIDHARTQLVEFGSKLRSFLGYYGAQALGFFGDDMRTGVNRETTGEAITVVKTGVAAAEKHIDLAMRCLREAADAVTEVRTRLHQAHAAQEMDFRRVVEKHEKNQAQSVERAKTQRQHNDLLFQAKRLEEIEAAINRHLTVRERLLAELSDDRDRRYEIRLEVVEMLNANLLPNIRVQIQQNADQTQYRRLLESCISAANIQRQRVAQALCGALTPRELTELIRAKNPAELARKGGINPEQARKVIDELAVPEKLMALETVDLDDLPRIDLNDNGVYKNSAGLSTGQKCTAILPILLFESENPLLIDQPEDNLDNRYVFETVVETIRKVRGSRQLIFVTHNPNIPVLGDAERVVVMQSDGRCGAVQKADDVDGCRKEIVDLLEGGADAFRRRGRRYHLESK